MNRDGGRIDSGLGVNPGGEERERERLKEEEEDGERRS